jgi:hypothetical protein
MLSDQHITYGNVIIIALPSQNPVQKQSFFTKMILFPTENYRNADCHKAVLPDVIKYIL